MSDDDNKWSRPAAPPPPMFTGKKERDLVKHINDEITERVVGQAVVYYPIDVENTNFDEVYGEAPVKNFLSPIHIYAQVEWQGLETSFEDSFGPDKRTRIMVAFQKRRLTEDRNVFVREGDYLFYDNAYYEIHTTSEPKELFGQQGRKFEVVAECIKAREGVFDAT